MLHFYYHGHHHALSEMFHIYIITCKLYVSSSHIKRSHYFIVHETLTSLPSTDWFQELIGA